MRTDIKTKSSDYTDNSGNKYKKITTTKNVKVTVGDIIGTAKSSGEALSALKRKASDPTIRKTAIAGLISPLISFASTMEAIKSAVKASSIIRKAINVGALASGTSFSPGNAAEIAQIGITAIKKILIAMALSALSSMKKFVWDYEIDLGGISNSTLILLSQKVEENGDIIKNKITNTFTNLPSLTDINLDFKEYNETSSTANTITPKKLSTGFSTISQINTLLPVETISSTPSVFISNKDINNKFFNDFTTNINTILIPEIKSQLIIKINADAYNSVINLNNEATIIFDDLKIQVNQYLYDSDYRLENFGTPSYINEISPLRTVIAKDSIYKIQKMDSVIDWETNVGMQPIYPITINELINSDDSIKEYLYDYNNIINKDEYNDLIKETKDFLNSRLSIMKSNMNLLIDSTSIDTTDLTESVDLSDKKRIIDLTTSFDDSQKIVSKELANNYLEEIINLSESQIKELIAAGLYETEMIYANQLKSFINYINILLLNSTITKTKAIELTNDYTFFYNFGFGLSIAFYNYLKALSINTYILNKYNDIDIINIAADFYKQEERVDLIDYIKHIISNINPYKKELNISNNYTSNIATLKTELNTLVNTETWTTKEELYTLVETYINNYNLVITPIEGSIDDINRILLKTKNNLFKEVEEAKNGLTFETFTSFIDDFPNRMGIDDKMKGYKYLNEIHEQLKIRITQLINLSYESLPLFIKNNLDKVIETKIVESNKAMKTTMKYHMKKYINIITDETIAEQRILINKYIEDMIIDIPVMRILETEIFYYINGIKKYFIDNSGVL